MGYSSLTRISIFPRHFALGLGTPLAILGVAITGDVNIGAVREVKSQMVWESTDLESSRFFVRGSQWMVVGYLLMCAWSVSYGSLLRLFDHELLTCCCWWCVYGDLVLVLWDEKIDRGKWKASGEDRKEHAYSDRLWLHTRSDVKNSVLNEWNILCLCNEELNSSVRNSMPNNDKWRESVNQPVRVTRQWAAIECKFATVWTYSLED